MSFNALEKIVAAVILASASTAVVSSFSANETVVTKQVQGLMAASEPAVPTKVRGLADPKRDSSTYLRKGANGKVIKIDPVAKVIQKGTMQSARSDSYQVAHYLNAQTLRPDPKSNATGGR